MSKLNMNFVALIAASTLALPVFAADTYVIDARHTFPAFEIVHFGYSTQRGRFNKTSGKIVLDRTAKTGSVDILIDAASVSTGLPKLEEHLRDESFLDAEKNPNITFKSKSLQFKGDTLVSVPGELTIRGITKPATLTVNTFHCAPHPMSKKEVCGADAVVTIKRSDYGITFALPGLADDVKLLIGVEAIKE